MRVEELIATNFPSWNGQADPGTIFGPEYANQYGNRLHWISVITGKNGDKVDIVDGFNYRLEENPYRPGGFENTISQYVAVGSVPVLYGVDYGEDAIRGTGDDTILTSGTGPVDEIVSIFPGIASAALDTSGDVAQQQAAIDAVVEQLKALGHFSMKLRVTFYGKTATSPVAFNCGN